MRTQRFKSRNHDIYLETFKDIREFSRCAEGRTENSWSNKTYISESDKEGLLHGWDKCLDRLNYKMRNLTDIKTSEKKLKEKIYTYNGYYPSVSRAVRGNPRCMGKYKTYTKASKIVEIIWDPGAASYEDPETMMEQGIKMLTKIKALELMGYRVRLMVQGFKGRSEVKKVYMCRVTIKEENQPLDLSRISYPLANIDMLRKWVFHWYEYIPDAIYISGYGKSLYLWSEPERNEILQTVNVQANQYYVNLGTDIDELFKSLTDI